MLTPDFGKSSRAKCASAGVTCNEQAYVSMIHKSILSRGCWNLMLMPRSRDVGLDSSRKKLKGYTHACVSESKDCSRVNKREES